MPADSEHDPSFGQHDVRWIPEGLPGAGHLLVFSNNVPGSEAPHSEVFEIAPPTDDVGRNVLRGSEPFGPTTPTWRYVAPDQTSFHSPFISGAHRPPGRPHAHHVRHAGTVLRSDTRG